MSGVGETLDAYFLFLEEVQMSKRIPIGYRKPKLKIDWSGAEPKPPPLTFWQRVKKWFSELPIWSIK